MPSGGQLLCLSNHIHGWATAARYLLAPGATEGISQASVRPRMLNSVSEKLRSIVVVKVVDFCAGARHLRNFCALSSSRYEHRTSP